VIKGLLREARPKQWAKNVLVFAAPGAAGRLDNRAELLRALVAFAAFCLASSGTYYWNDINDVAADRRHPTKRQRPIASGVVPLGVARVVGTLLLVGGIGAGFALNHKLGIAVAGYVAITSLYSTALKHIAVVDLVAVAAGFLMRAIGGALATNVTMSQWFLLCTSFGSLFIVTGKRYAELRDYGEHAGAGRASLDDYTLGFLRIVLATSVGATLVAYCEWAFATKELSGTTKPYYELSIVPMVTALLRYTLILEQGHGAAPEEIFLADRTLQVLGVLWVVVFGLGVYVG
jgi:decaprenyl-phosphate phosphoribosyltransferase